MARFIDVFCGCGGLSCGLRDAGWMPVAGVDASPDAVKAYATNFPEAEALRCDLSDAQVREDLVARFRGKVEGMVGGPPCQGFSRRNMRKGQTRFDEMNKLPSIFAQMAVDLGVKVVVMEEVRDAAKVVLPLVTATLQEAGFEVHSSVLDASRHGVPQRRLRMIIVATKTPFHFSGWPAFLPVTSVRQAFTIKPVPEEGYKITRAETLRHIRTLRATNTRMIGGNFSIMNMEAPSPTIHTKTYPGAGPYVIERGDGYYALSVEEAARLQSFPASFEFPCTTTTARRLIGNAVPCQLAYQVASCITRAPPSPP